MLKPMSVPTGIPIPPALASGVPFVAGSPAITIAGRAPAGITGIRSTRAVFARLAYINGLQRNVFPVTVGPRTRIGMSDSGWLDLFA